MSRCSSVNSKSTGQVYGRARALGPVLLPLALVGGVALDNGGFDATAWGWSTLLPLVILGAALVLGRARRLNGLALAFLCLFAALTAWTWLSVAWSNDVSASVLDGERARAPRLRGPPAAGGGWWGVWPPPALAPPAGGRRAPPGGVAPVARVS